tara:strand:- start:32 stop:910 length:879 start_codon:yes stop_codon:yes gene_type:complete
MLLRTNKLGLSPDGTKLTVIYKVNDFTSANVPVNALNTVGRKIVEFDNPDSLVASTKRSVENSLEITNDEPISEDTSGISNEELKVRAKNHYAAQNRAVSKQDYESLCYSMPPKFGSIKRANAINDPSGTNRRLALYLISANSNGKLTTTNSVTKQNLKKWISSYKMLNDVIDIYDAKVVNFGIDFEISVTRDSNPTDVTNRVINKIIADYDFDFYIGEPIYISEIANIITKVNGVSDLKKIKIYNKTDGLYSATSINFDDIKSRDATFYKAPKNAIFELKYPLKDIKGVAR